MGWMQITEYLENYLIYQLRSVATNPGILVFRLSPYTDVLSNRSDVVDQMRSAICLFTAFWCKGTTVRVELGDATTAADPSGEHGWSCFCGRQSPGGHNVIWGIHDALKIHNPNSTLLGFLEGLIESIPEVYALLQEIHGLLTQGVSADKISSQLSPWASALFEFLPPFIKKQKSRPPQFDGPGADLKGVTLCVEDQDTWSRIKKLQEYLDKPGCSQDVLKAALSAMSSFTDILSVMASPSSNVNTPF
ncbi:hypothetical protein HAX54_035812 [Datura stramonium]|uniref:Uncharacterized protein n=1 Tax=Datura stramonium TaxID=4076 RepID=A0ABS8RNQ1_DATST|nr:hypothetical protein [Datura stramonium]